MLFVCTHLVQHCPVNPHAHPAPALPLAPSWCNRRNKPKHNLQNRGLSTKCPCVCVFGSKSYFSLLELQEFQFRLWVHFFSNTTFPNPRTHTHTCPLSKSFLFHTYVYIHVYICIFKLSFLCKENLSLSLPSHVPITENLVPINDWYTQNALKWIIMAIRSPVPWQNLSITGDSWFPWA